LLTPEPGPVGVNVDPLGEEPGAIAFPDGFLVLFVPILEPAALPVVPGFVLAPGFAGAGLPTVGAALCASANVLDSANAVASAIVVSFMVISLGWN
jgi:hypothetical protein